MKVKRAKLYQIQEGICWLCKTHMRYDETSVDHIIPKSKGGSAKISNLKLAHKICNSLRGNTPADQVPRSTWFLDTMTKIKDSPKYQKKRKLVKPLLFKQGISLSEKIEAEGFKD